MAQIRINASPYTGHKWTTCLCSLSLFCWVLIDSGCCLTNVQHRSLVFQAHLWDITLAFEALICTKDFFWRSHLGYYSWMLLPMISLDVDRWQASHCCFLQLFRGDELALSDILQLLSTMDKQSCLLSLHSNVHLNSPTSVFVYRGFDVGQCQVSPSAFHVWPGGGTLNGFPCLRFLGGEKTHTLITTGSLVVALCEGIPTCDWGCKAGGGMCEISVWEGWRLGSSSERWGE